MKCITPGSVYSCAAAYLRRWVAEKVNSGSFLGRSMGNKAAKIAKKRVGFRRNRARPVDVVRGV